MKRVLAQAVLIIALFAVPCLAEEMKDVKIKTIRVAEGIHMLRGKGGNIGVFSGKDGVFLVDDQFAPLTARIREAVREISPEEIRFLINTHWHGDHVGGNENFGKAGTVIFAHENVRKRMSSEQFMEFFNRRVPAAPKAALPVVTFTRDIAFHLNGEEVRVFHAAGAHTDGDAVVVFTTSNVIHAGDLYFAGAYPFIDLGSGGSVDGVIAALKRILSLADGDTKIIPGHGHLSNREELSGYLKMLSDVRDRVARLVSQGKTLETILRERPSRDYDEKWGGGFIGPEKFIRILHGDLTR